MESNAGEPRVVRNNVAPDGTTPPVALARAWFLWGGLIAVILLTAIVVLWIMVLSSVGSVNASNDLAPAGQTLPAESAGAAIDESGNIPAPGIHPAWDWPFLSGLILLALAMGGLFVRRHYFDAYYHGEVVRPDNYLKGMAAVWVPIFVAVFVSEIMTVISGDYFPTPFAAIMGTLLLFIMAPNGRSMTLAVGGSDDPGSYEEPK